MIIIDLFGLPGAGKSTIARELYVKLKKSGINVEFFNKNEYFDDENYKKRNLFDYIKLFKLRNICFYTKFVLKKSKKEIIKQGFKEKIWKKLRLVMLYDKLTQKNHNIEVCIVDQGIVQDFSDYHINSKIEKEFVQHYLNCFLKSDNEFAFIYCDLEIENAISRIKNRNRKLYKFDMLNEHDLRCFLNKEDNKIKLFEECLKNNKNFVKIYSSETLLTDNMKKIMDKYYSIERKK